MKQFSKRIVASGCGAMTSIRSVTEKPSVAVGKTKADRPLAPGASPLRAKSVRTSAIAPFAIQVFSPLLIQPPSTFVAPVSNASTSDPDRALVVQGTGLSELGDSG